MKFQIGHMKEGLHNGTYGLIVDTYYTPFCKITFVGAAWGFNTFGITIVKKRTDDE